MLDLQSIRESNSQLREGQPEFVAVMGGATSGIGEATCRELVRNDVALLENVDDVCKRIAAEAGHVNLLFLSANVLRTARTPTSEGIDQMMALQYYSRVRFITNLLPSLQSAGSKGELARVVSVLGAGKEGRIFHNDLLLEQNFSLSNCASQAMCMTSLAFEHLAEENGVVSFLHVSPGVLRRTTITAGFGRVVSAVSRVLMTLAIPFTVSVEESGERHLYFSTKKSYEPTRAQPPLRSFRLDFKGQVCPIPDLLAQYLKDGTQDEVWSHTTDVFTSMGRKYA
ncbi:unnamed protein product [Clonostachys rhizophaga]|uniref:Uncharacterized protein n=1 Tax=Clonostachys rhizophaga TaxID=160324 RepID=A0A9N9VZA5_9HYPO|nr:unnamed protein product [Clonostachys rhizophaga]